jgi:hypothetical protein
MAKKSHTGADAVFSASEQREQTVKDIIEKERAEVAARSARLKALRLAKEAADREAAAKLPPEKPKRTRKKTAPTGNSK